jgi:hypothetical protein
MKMRKNQIAHQIVTLYPSLIKTEVPELLQDAGPDGFRYFLPFWALVDEWKREMLEAELIKILGIMLETKTAGVVINNDARDIRFQRDTFSS